MKMQTTWDLKKLYNSLDDPQMTRDMDALEKAYAAFEKKYKNNTAYLADNTKLLQALKEYEKLIELKNPGIYLFLYKDIDSSNPKVEAKSTMISHQMSVASNRIVFFSINLGKLSKIRQKELLADTKFAHFWYFLKVLFDQSMHDLTEAEEKIVNLLSLPAYSMWVDGQKKLLGIQTIKFKGKDMPFTEALEKVASLPVKDRRAVWKLIIEKMKSVSAFAESELNAVVTEKKIIDELRGYTKPYSSTVLKYQNDEESVESLVGTVTSQFHIAQRFYKVKKQLLGLPELTYIDKSVSAGEGKNKKKFPFDQAVKIVESAFSKVNKKYADYLRSYLQEGQIDVFPRKNKRSGGYCAPSFGNPTYILLNHTDDFHSVTTLAHEMGHAIHSEFSKTQPALYEDVSTSVAEVASTFFEHFAFDEVFETLSEKEKMYALHDRLNNDISTIFRQIALFNFENELHVTIREKGTLSKDEIAKLLAKHMRAYLGPAVKVTDDDGYSFMSWPHIRYFFYVYSYAYGQIISHALYAKYKEDNSYIQKVDEFLKAGGSKSPEQIFKDIGIDTTRPSFFEAGLKSIEEDVIRLEKMVKSATTKK